MKKTVFLGGTCNNSLWRDAIIPKLKINYYNPVVENWTIEHENEELKQRESCDYCLYVLTPKMTGVFSIAEVVDDSNKRPEKTIFCVLTTDEEQTFTSHQLKSMNAVGKMVAENGAKVFSTIEKVADYLNG
jgi:Nucleoside 2-deoxyribosyltransferase like